ncbi:GuaB3 family IMP dehydrogenase-related protein [Bifidobacterium sp. W8108]|uniref:GuaB3 family IMP dehydrogenase-related protein n=1 Tax=unclassified Bifidobacterium TaxID=2608897 RepID=UPI0018DB362C|nr:MULTISPECIES: GuaB3 family IMP dehydrogenase-related protein [unclassified Bifidobacterium]MBH9978903.1 GuaB3 family IMP dehydrogenase-related protein [Bifidobacterium sp. W8108]MBI0173226.1 GuaB3 family IMP dehydrogenase-related protein [Bifidobacterium sp. M0307]
MTQEIEIGLGKKATVAYTLDDVSILPSRRTRDPQDVSTSWQVDAYEFDIPLVAAPMDSVTSPETAIELGKLGGLGVLDLEGLWTRYEDPRPQFERIAGADPDQATKVMQSVYREPIKPELITRRLHEIREAGVTVAGALSPQRTQEFYSTVVEAGVDLFVIRGTAVSAEHVSSNHEPLNLKQFIYDLDVPVIVGGAATYQAALHLMRTGAAGVLVGFGGGASSTDSATVGIQAPMATAIADVAEARRDYMDESGGRYVQVIADGETGTSGSFIKALAMGADAVMLGTPLAKSTDAPGRGMHWGAEAHHPELPRGRRVRVDQVGSLHDILFGPSSRTDGSLNMIGALRRAMASTGYVDMKSFQRCKVAVAAGLQV